LRRLANDVKFQIAQRGRVVSEKSKRRICVITADVAQY
jgi:hypothetical protein